MKKLTLILIAFVTFQFTACKSETKKETKEIEKSVEKTALFSLKNAKTTVGWTAYKTTDKIGVKGQFKKINITAGGKGNSIKEAINGAKFSIPVSSIFTKDDSRDFKIRKFFFGVMKNTSLLSGKLTLEDNTKGTAEITMNGVTEKLSFEYKIENKTFSMNTVMNLEKWSSNSALASLNKVCKDLHTGADGISKTWSDVAIHITSIFE